MKFFYEGINTKTAERVQGELDGVSDTDIVNMLAARNIEVYSVTPHNNNHGKSKKVAIADLVLPLQELATLSESGVTLLDAVNALANNKEHLGIAHGFKKIASLIESGEPFSEAIAQSIMPFPDYVKHLVSAGELSGELATALRNASRQMTYDQEVRNEIKSALTYPLVLIASGIAAMLIIFFAVVPKFSHMLNEDKELPTLAWLVLSAGKYANDYPYLIFGGIGAALFIIFLFFSNQAVKIAMANFALRLPVIGSWLSEQDAAKWASLSAAMLGARVGLINTLTLAAESSMFETRRIKAKEIVNDVQTGMTLTESLERAAFLPPSSVNLVAVGDKTGQLSNMLGAVSRLHDDACKRKMKQVLTLVEPIAILIVGAMIGVMILGIVMAITATTDIAI